MQTQTQSSPYARVPETDPTRWFLGVPTRFLATRAQTGGAYGLVEQQVPIGGGSPWHVHHGEDEAFYVVEGEVSVRIGEQTLRAGPGGFVFAPRDIPHGFRVEGTQPARLLLLLTPGGFEGFFDAMSEPAPPAGPPDLDHLVRAAAGYHCEIFGPWPE
jgi:quercetin dioxygenase-like cupin family protein